jgi:hypothetical protein
LGASNVVGVVVAAEKLRATPARKINVDDNRQCLRANLRGIPTLILKDGQETQSLMPPARRNRLVLRTS